MKTILVPTDFSKCANNALDLAQQLADKHEMEIKLLHIVEQPSAPYITAVSGGLNDQLGNVYILRIIEKAKAQLELIVADLSHKEIKASYQIKIGNPYKTISNHIKKESCNLIIMGTNGVSGFDEVLVGSNTEKVVRHATVPVITVKNPITLDKIKNLVVALTPPTNRDALAWEIKNLVRLFDTKLHLVNVNTPSNFVNDRDGMQFLVEFAKDFHLKQFTVNTYSDLTEEAGIRHFAEDHQGDIIVMATHGRTGINHLLSGSLSEQLVNHSDLPVITLPLKNVNTNPVKDVVL